MANFYKQPPIPLKQVDIKVEDEFSPMVTDGLISVESLNSNSTLAVMEENSSQLERGKESKFQLSDNRCHPLEISEDLVDKVFAKDVDNDDGWGAFFSKFNTQNRENLVILPSTGSAIDARADTVDNQIIEEDREEKVSILNNRSCPVEIPEEPVERIFAQNGDNKEEWDAFFSKFNMQNSSTSSVIDSGGEKKDPNITRELVSSKLQYLSDHPEKTDYEDKSFIKMKNNEKSSDIGGDQNCVENNSASSAVISSNKKFCSFSGQQSSSNIFYDGAIKLKPVSVALINLFPKKSTSSSRRDRNVKSNRFSDFETAIVNEKKDLITKENRRSKAILGNICHCPKSSDVPVDSVFVQNVNEEELDAFFSKFNMQNCEDLSILPSTSSDIDAVAETVDPNITKESVSYQQHSTEHTEDSDHYNKRGNNYKKNHSCCTVDIRSSIDKFGRDLLIEQQSSSIFYDSAIKLMHVSVVLKDLFPKTSVCSLYKNKNRKFKGFSEFERVVVKKKKNLMAEETTGNEVNSSSSKSHPMEIPEDLVDRVLAQTVVNEEELDAFFSKFNLQDSENLAILPSTSSVIEAEVESINSSISIGNVTAEDRGNIINFTGKKCHPLEIPEDLVDKVFAQNAVNEEELDAFFSKFNMQKCENLAISPSNSSVIKSGTEPAVSKNSRDNQITEEDRDHKVNFLGNRCNLLKIREDLTDKVVVTEEELDAFFSKFNMQNRDNFSVLQLTSSVPKKEVQIVDTDITKELVAHHQQNPEESNQDFKPFVKLIKSEKTYENDGGKNYVETNNKNNSFSPFSKRNSIKKSCRDLANKPHVLSKIFYDGAIKLMPVSVVLKDLFPKNSISSQQRDKFTKSRCSDFETAVIKKERDLVKVTDREISEQELDVFFFRFDMQDCKNPPNSSPFNLKGDNEKQSFSIEPAYYNPQYLRKQHDEKDHDEKPLVKVIKCEKTDSEVDDDRQDLENRFCSVAGIKPQIRESSRELVSVQQSLSNTFQNSSCVKLKRLSVVLEDLFPKNSSSSSHRHSDTRPCLCIYCTDKVQEKIEPQSDSETCSSTKPDWSGHSLEKLAPKRDYFKCTLCLFRHKSSMIMKRHSVICHGLYLCTTCLAKFEHKRDLRRHERKHLPIKLHPCPECGKRFRDKLYMRRHLLSVHATERRFSCDQCSAKFKSRIVLKAHYVTHTDERPFSCAQCPLRFKLKGRLQTHVRIHTNDRPHSCPQCFKKFKLTENLNSHMKRHSDEKLFTCGECAARFRTKKEVFHHLLVHMDERPLSCAVCPGKFKTSKALKLHSVVHVNDRPFSCSLCSRKFKQKQDMRNHLQQVHFNKVVYPCLQCGAKLKSKRGLETHMVIHSDEKPFACPLCPAKFKLKQCLIPHMKVHSDQKPFSCTSCSAKFKDIDGLRTHSVVHSDDRPFSCSHCLLKFKTRTVLLAHVKRHFTEKNIECSHCPAKFKDKVYLRYHMRKHSSEEKMYSCADCPAKFWTKTLIRLHVVKHSEEKPYTCSVCSYKCKLKGQLTNHMKIHAAKKQYECAHCLARFAFKTTLRLHIRTHTKEKPYSCSLCTYRCRDSSLLKAHLKTHSKERPHACTHCSATFKDKRYLKRHIKSHFDEKPFACGHCSRRFKHKDILLTHIRTHTGEKPFACKLCPARFIQLHHLKSHSLLHTNEKPFSCSQCSAVFRHKSSLTCHIDLHHTSVECPCPYCPVKCKSSVSLKRHLKLHSSGELFACPNCPLNFKIKASLTSHLKMHSDEKRYECAHCLAKLKGREGLKHHIASHMNERLFSCPQCSKRYNGKTALYHHVKAAHPTSTQTSNIL